MAKITATTGDADFTEVANMGLTPEAQEAMDKALGKTADAPVEAPAPAEPKRGSENSTVSTASVPSFNPAPADGKSEKINGLTVTNF